VDNTSGSADGAGSRLGLAWLTNAEGAVLSSSCGSTTISVSVIMTPSAQPGRRARYTVPAIDPTTVNAMAMCEACAALERGDSRGTGHPDLAKVGDLRPMANGGFRADEQDYECRACGTKWMHETGNSGFGWVEQ